MKYKKLFRALCFTLVTGMTVLYVQYYLGADEQISFENQRGLYLEQKNSLDAVYIGSSNVHYFWSPPVAWASHGITVWSFSNNAQPIHAIKYLLTEARKLQPNALYIINVNGFKEAWVNIASFHSTTDYIPISLNKVRMIYRLAQQRAFSEFSALEKMEFFLPIIRFHSRWSSLGSWVFTNPCRKGCTPWAGFLHLVTNLSKCYTSTENKIGLTSTVNETLRELLDYCDAKKLKVLFVEVPQALEESSLARLNTVEATLKLRGYPVLNLLKDVSIMGIQSTTDYYDAWHLNIHGSLKFTEYLSRYLIEHYGFKDKRGQPGWESWDESIEQYGRVINPWTLPLEREYAPRDYSLSSPSLNRPAVKEQDVTVSWKAVKGAEGYEIYRKSNAEQRGYWHHVKTVSTDVLSHSDRKLKAKTQYTYTVVPFRKENGKTLYGHFSFNGVTATTGGK